MLFAATSVKISRAGEQRKRRSEEGPQSDCFRVAKIAHLLFMGIVAIKTMNPGGNLFYICVPPNHKSGHHAKVGYERE